MARASEMLGHRDVSFGVGPVLRTILSMVRAYVYTYNVG